MKHFLDLSDIAPRDLRAILDMAVKLKKARAAGEENRTLAGKKLAMIFEKNSTRTRVSFEVGMLELGGQAIYLSGKDTQIGRGETISDTAKVLSRYIDIIMLRCHKHEMLTELAQHSAVPVVNGLTGYSHPCQIMADILTYEEHRGPITGKKVAWFGDGNNVCHSFIHAAAKFGFTLAVACPQELMPDPLLVAWAQTQGATIEISANPQEAAKGAHLLVTDTWVSMGDSDSENRMRLLQPYQVDEALMQQGEKDALFMHCLPAHRGEEVTAEVLDGARSVVWDEAENRLHVQKAIMLWCLEKF
ncbi:MAG TPA: ornithine carbamoyltransferase [Rickettsiales bacterium]|nr:ornithine carbamoyltransferase [Rickettsiales bacterium]